MPGRQSNRQSRGHQVWPGLPALASYFFFFLAFFFAAFFLATVCPPLKQVHGGDGADTQHSFIRLSIKQLGPQRGACDRCDIPSVADRKQELL